MKTKQKERMQHSKGNRAGGANNVLRHSLDASDELLFLGVLSPKLPELILRHSCSNRENESNERGRKENSQQILLLCCVVFIVCFICLELLLCYRRPRCDGEQTDDSKLI